MTVAPGAGRPDAASDSPWLGGRPNRGHHGRRPIADKYADLLRPLNNQQRRAMILRLTYGFYEGWRPSRQEMADLVAVELGILSTEEALRRQHHRNLRGC